MKQVTAGTKKDHPQSTNLNRIYFLDGQVPEKGKGQTKTGGRRGENKRDGEKVVGPPEKANRNNPVLKNGQGGTNTASSSTPGQRPKDTFAYCVLHGRCNHKTANCPKMDEADRKAQEETRATLKKKYKT